MSKRLILFLFILGLTFYSCLQPKQPMIPIPVEVAPGQKVKHDSFQAAISRFEAQLAHDVAEDSIGSISAGVVVGNNFVWTKGFGWADIKRQTPANADTIYRTGSISKSFTAVLMMLMIEEGYFKLDDPVEKYFPEINNLADKPGNGEPITFRHLASHTAGLVREPKMKGAATGPISLWENRILASIPKTSYQSLPGEKYSYSNIGFGILGLAVSRAVGRPFMDLVEEYIFDPLGMRSSFFILREKHLPHLAMGYVHGRDGSVNPDYPAKEHAGRGYNAGMIFDPESKIGVVIFRNYNRGKTNLGLSIRDLLKNLASSGENIPTIFQEGKYEN